MKIDGLNVIYTKDYRLNASYLEVFHFYVQSLKKYHKFIRVNFQKNFKASYQQSFLRILWKIILPLVPVSVYVVLQELGLLKGNAEMPRVIYVVIGMTFWQLFSASLSSAMNAPEKEKAMLKKINIPFILFYLSALGTVIFDYLVRVVLIWALLIIFKTPFSLIWFTLPFLFIPLALLGSTLGIFISFFSVFVGDIKNIVDICLRYGLFASGVLFPLPSTGMLVQILNYNPVYIFLDNLRQLIVFSEFSSLKYFSIAFIGLLVATIVIFKKLYTLESRLREFL